MVLIQGADLALFLLLNHVQAGKVTLLLSCFNSKKK